MLTWTYNDVGDHEVREEVGDVQDERGGRC